MLKTVEAERFVREDNGGKTLPLVLACRDSEGHLLDVYAKFSWQQCPQGGLIREVISALLCIDLGIPVATPVLVHFDDLFIESILLTGMKGAAEIVQRLQGSVRPAFGSESVGPGYSMCRGPEASMPHAEDVWAFDQLTLNPDRHIHRANCLTDGNRIVAIDHEMALLVSQVGSFLCPAPWTKIMEPQHPHLFMQGLCGRTLSLDGLEDRWMSIPLSRLQEYGAAIPSSWDDGSGLIAEIVRYLEALRENLPAAFRELRKMLP